MGIGLEWLIDDRAAEALIEAEERRDDSPDNLARKLHRQDVESLYRLARRGDSPAALYLGRAILAGLASFEEGGNLAEVATESDSRHGKLRPDCLEEQSVMLMSL